MFGAKATFGAIALTSIAMAFATAGGAEAARKRCVFMAHDASGHMMADGWAKAIKKSWACNRAERRCNRELDRKRRQGKAGRGACRRITNL
jgi:hypothetical protein